MKRWANVVWLVAVLAAALPASALARAGDLDRSFGGGDGTASHGGQFHLGVDLLLQPDGRIVALGDRYYAEAEFNLMRLRPGGAFDRSFGGDGRTRTAFPGQPAAAGLARQPGGKLIVLSDFRRPGFVRYTADGRLDRTFGGDGTVAVECPPGWGCFTAASPIVKSDGKIVAAFDAFHEDDQYVLLGRFLPNGRLDPTFGEGGWGRLPVPAAIRVEDLVRQADGKYVVVGGSNEELVEEEFLVARFRAGGRPDLTFGGDGYQLTNFVVGPDMAKGVAPRRDGRLLVVGSYGDDCNSTVACARRGWAFAAYEADGDLDPTFSGNGKLMVLPGKRTEATDLELDGRGRAIVVGSRKRPQEPSLSVVVRLRSDGSFDHSFGRRGRVYGPHSGAKGVALRPSDGKILVLGQGLSVARYHNR